MREGGPKFDPEYLLHLSVFIAPSGEERGELMRGVTPVHLEGEKTAVLMKDVTGRALNLSLVIVPNLAVVTYESWIYGTSGPMSYESVAVCTRRSVCKTITSQCMGIGIDNESVDILSFFTKGNPYFEIHTLFLRQQRSGYVCLLLKKEQFLNFYTCNKNLQGSLDLKLIMLMINGLCTKEV